MKYKFVEGCSDIDAIKVLKQRLQATVSIAMTSTKQIKTTLVPKKTYAPNTNHEKQFNSTPLEKKVSHLSLGCLNLLRKK